MKRFVCVFLIAMIGSALVSCTGESAENSGLPDMTPQEPAAPAPEEPTVINYSPDEEKAPSILATGGESIFRFTATGAWTASVTGSATRSEAWLAVDPASGEAGTVTLRITAAPNEEESRGGSVLIASLDGNDAVLVTVSQSGKEIKQNEPGPETTDDDILKKIPDQAFRNYLQKGTDKNTGTKFDADGNGKISEAEAAAVRKIVVNNLAVKDLSGLEYFPNLEQLHCSGFDFSDFTKPGGGNYPSDKVELTSLDLSHNTKLKYLDCCDNKTLKHLDLSANTALVTLVCDDCALETLILPETEVSRLETLLCNGNALSVLDLSKHPNVETLWCNNNNKITALDISACTNLVELRCQNCELSELNVSGNARLFSLYCFGNQLSALDLSGNPKIQLLFCGSNNIRTLDVSKTNLPASSFPVSLDCLGMNTGNDAFTLVIKNGWRRTKYRLPENTVIRYE